MTYTQTMQSPAQRLFSYPIGTNGVPLSPCSWLSYSSDKNHVTAYLVTHQRPRLSPSPSLCLSLPLEPSALGLLLLRVFKDRENWEDTEELMHQGDE